jgi:hypothetical protein
MRHIPRQNGYRHEQALTDPRRTTTPLPPPRAVRCGCCSSGERRGVLCGKGHPKRDAGDGRRRRVPRRAAAAALAELGRRWIRAGKGAPPSGWVCAGGWT